MEDLLAFEIDSDKIVADADSTDNIQPQIQALVSRYVAGGRATLPTVGTAVAVYAAFNLLGKPDPADVQSLANGWDSRPFGPPVLFAHWSGAQIVIERGSAMN